MKEMQSETADFAPGAATYRTGQNTHRIWFWPVHSIMWNHDVIHI